MPSGECQCHTGWTGVNCTEPTCTFCGRHGSCLNETSVLLAPPDPLSSLTSPNAVFTNLFYQGCKCSPGYAGVHCETLVGLKNHESNNNFNPICDPNGRCICSAEGESCPPGGKLMINQHQHHHISTTLLHNIKQRRMVQT